MPRYKDATYGGETKVLENGAMRVEFHRRTTGWGWAELYTPDGKLMGVLEHLGEVKYPDQRIPTRLEASEFTLEQGDSGSRLHFDLRETTHEAMTDRSTTFGPFYKRPDRIPQEPQYKGEAVFALHPELPVLSFEMRCVAQTAVTLSYIRGPWLRAGAASFGAAKTDAIFSGVEWCLGDEWSSSTDWFPHPWALRMAPHPLKVTAPFMAVSHEGHAIGLAWDPTIKNMFHMEHHYNQPVFASPNFIDKKNQHILGLMFPAVTQLSEENRTASEQGFAFLPSMQARFAGEIMLAEGNSLDCMAAWCGRRGMPAPPPQRYPLAEALDRIARAYNTRLWHEGKGWGMDAESARPHEPWFIAQYVAKGADSDTAAGLQRKLDALRAHPEYAKPRLARGLGHLEGLDADAQIAHGRELMAGQREDGAFPFDPHGKHGRGQALANHIYCEDTRQPLGEEGDTALDLCVLPATELLELYRLTGQDEFATAARKALDHCLDMTRPEGGDWWETPLRSPNLLAAGHAAIAYYQAFERLDIPAYRDKAVYWIRALLPFTQFWQPDAHPSLYNTKPCFCATNWWLSNWVDWHVQWEVLQTFAISHVLGIDWAQIDPAIDWRTYREGVTTAALRWMIDHEDPGRTTHDTEKVLSGQEDTLYYDIHDAVSGFYGGALILPEPIATNLVAILEEKGLW